MYSFTMTTYSFLCAFPLPSATRAGFLREVPGDCFRHFLLMSRRFPVDTAPSTWEYVHPTFPHSPKYIKSMHCPWPPMPTSDMRIFWERMRVYMSTPGFRTRKSDIMDTISGIRVGSSTSRRPPPAPLSILLPSRSASTCSISIPRCCGSLCSRPHYSCATRSLPTPLTEPTTNQHGN